MRGRVETTARAREDLHEIWARIALHDVAAADRMARKLSAAFDLLTTFSGMGTGRPDLGQGFRSWPVKPYLIFFRNSPDGIIVVRVLPRGARRRRVRFPLIPRCSTFRVSLVAPP